jgi:GNAT superfamily N-acetyltransferase
VPELPRQRLAVAADAPGIAELMRRSALELFPLFYGEREAASAAVYLTEPDMALVRDGTYFVHEHDGEIVACGGWSRRQKLYTGSGPLPDDTRLLDPDTDPARVRAMFVRGDWTRRGLAKAVLGSCEDAARAAGFRSLALMATLPGVPLYLSSGFRDTGRVMVRLPDGVSLECVTMLRDIPPA